MRAYEYPNILPPEEMVYGINLNELPVAYCVDWVSRCDVVNQSLGSRGVLVVAHCDLCGIPNVFIHNQPLENSGLLVELAPQKYSMLMYEKELQNNNLWQVTDGMAVSGPAALRGGKLSKPDWETMSWQDWSGENPNSWVMLQSQQPKTKSLAGSVEFALRLLLS